ncbi:MAG: hypothetical protein HFJ29_04855 [Clostridia bacterium]|nr:hypothetical protein [Clostridia bacterium]MCI9246551.1 hypothetical protein [Clostridia bacterium]
MEKIKRYIPRIIILDTIICLLIITMLFFILHFFNLMFRQWIYVMFAILIILGFIIGTMQLLLKIKRKVIKISSILIFIIILLLSSPIVYLGIVFGYMPEYIVKRDGKKYVAYVNGFLKTYVYYYDYKNLIVVGNQKKIEEYYGRGGFDPINNKYGYNYEVVRTTYYDESGNVLSIDENKIIE